MWVITYHVIPKPSSREFERSGGAYVDCWILYAWQDGAEMLARYEVEKEWTITNVEGISWIEIDDIKDDDPDKCYFDQALIDGGTFVYNLYPLEGTESDEDFDLENSTTQNPKVLRADH